MLQHERAPRKKKSEWKFFEIQKFQFEIEKNPMKKIKNFNLKLKKKSDENNHKQ